jgi:hypothetical protein
VQATDDSLSGVLAATFAFGAVHAMAATRSGITSNKVVAVASCDTDGHDGPGRAQPREEASPRRG